MVQLNDKQVINHNNKLIARLNRIALDIRKNLLIMTSKAGSGHPGGSLSSVDIITALYFHQMRHDPKNPNWDDRDRFILSKGHACPALYAALAEAGYFPKETLWTLRKMGSILDGHPDMNKTPGVDASTGNLGMGLSIGLGMALAGRLDYKEYKVYVLLGDGELDEGQVWEAAMAVVHYKTNNILAIVDRNNMQLDGFTRDVMSLGDLVNKWSAFGWHVLEIDGHNIKQILDALDIANEINEKPVVIIANTIKGKGVSFMENQVYYHGKTLTEESLQRALAELDGGIK